MKITTRKLGRRHWRAGCDEVPGSPYEGLGSTERFALAHLLILMHYHYPNFILKEGEKLWINDKLYSLPRFYKERS